MIIELGNVSSETKGPPNGQSTEFVGGQLQTNRKIA